MTYDEYQEVNLMIRRLEKGLEEAEEQLAQERREHADERTRIYADWQRAGKRADDEIIALKKCAAERLDWARVAENKTADLKDELKEAREKFDYAWDRLGDANDLIDTMNEWVGEFAVKYNMPLQALARDMQAIKDGWDLPNTDSPWDADETQG